MTHDTYTRTVAQSCSCIDSCGCDAGDQGCLCAHLGRHADTAPPMRQRVRHLVPRVATALAALAFVAACSHGQAEPADLDVARVRLSEHSVYRVSYKSDATPIPVNQLHSWTLHIETPDGRPVPQAAVEVDGEMPQHGHGLPTRPRVTRELGNGDYLVEGMKFQMGGWWVMKFTVAAGDRADLVKFNLKLQQ
jgi:hypothetical protein